MALMSLNEIAAGSWDLPRLPYDVFEVPGMLADAQLVEVRVDPGLRNAYFLFDLRQALQLRLANTGLLILLGVTSLDWVDGAQQGRRRAFAVGSATFGGADGHTLEMRFWGGAELKASFGGARFSCVDVEGLPEVAADFSLVEELVLPTLPKWESRGSIVGTSVMLDGE